MLHLSWLRQNLMWMYLNIGYQKKTQWHDIGLSLFLWFMLKQQYLKSFTID
jgi:hypothetical protein